VRPWVWAVQKDLCGLMYSNVVVTGGCAVLPGFKDRFQADLRPLAPSEEALLVSAAADPVSCAWQAGQQHGAP
jgi:actin-related protein 6